MGVPIAHEKTVALTTSLVLLGIEIDTSVMQARLPRDKLAEIATLVNQWRQKRACRKKEFSAEPGGAPVLSDTLDYVPGIGNEIA